MRRRALKVWVESHAVALASPLSGGADTSALSILDEPLEGADLVFLGEANHFVHEKSDFRLLFSRYLISRGWKTFAEELGWSDGQRIERYLASGDERILDGLSLFGCRDGLRADRDDKPTGILARSFDTYPHDPMRIDHGRFYRGLARAGRGLSYFGFDIDALPGAGYGDIERMLAPFGGERVVDGFLARLERVPGESAAEEADRLRRLVGETDPLAEVASGRLAAEVCAAIAALADSLDYVDKTYPATSYEALRPGMAFREGCMKRRFADLRRLSGGNPTLVMSHALHLAKDDRLIAAASGVGPGGGLASSIGHHLTQELGLKVVSIWMLYSGGEDSQPLPDLPRKAKYARDTLNAQLAGLKTPMLFRVADLPSELAQRPIGVGHMYNAVARTALAGQVDVILVLPTVSPLRS